MSSENTPTTHTNDIERCQQRWDIILSLKYNKSRDVRLARCQANYSRQRQQTLDGEYCRSLILVMFQHYSPTVEGISLSNVCLMQKMYDVYNTKVGVCESELP